MSSVKVAVRVRPSNKREKGSKSSVQVQENTVQLQKPGEPQKSHSFAYDHLYPSEPTTQEQVYNELGKDMLAQAFQGYNICIFAYGQTGSGKSYTMMGDVNHAEKAGIIPRLCTDLFEKIQNTIDLTKDTEKPVLYSVEVSYMEIYCERVRDLLQPSNKNLKVREHKKLGPYVEGLSKCVVKNSPDISRLMDEGNKSRTVASTNMNSESSRSHGVFQIMMTEKIGQLEKVSKISLVDLAGSERASKTGAVGQQLKEGANINKSLTTLGKVIQALAESSENSSTNQSKKDFIPYRESVLTWLLKENLGGNSKTAMIATISPSEMNFEETLSTLRYADRAKNIKCKAIVNEDPRAKIIRELKEEIEKLKLEQTIAEEKSAETPTRQINDKTFQISKVEVEKFEKMEVERIEIEERLAVAENLVIDLDSSWEEKMKKTEEIHKERTRMLVEMGVALNTTGEAVGVSTSKKTPHLVNLNEDPLMSECLLYYLKPEGLSSLGCRDDQDIVLFDPFKDSIREEHCVFNATETDDHPYPRVVLVPIDAEHYSAIKNVCPALNFDHLLKFQNNFRPKHQNFQNSQTK